MRIIDTLKQILWPFAAVLAAVFIVKITGVEMFVESLTYPTILIMFLSVIGVIFGLDYLVRKQNKK